MMIEFKERFPKLFRSVPDNFHMEMQDEIVALPFLFGRDEKLLSICPWNLLNRGEDFWRIVHTQSVGGLILEIRE